MDSEDDGSVSYENFVRHSIDLELPDQCINLNKKILFKKIDKNESGFISLLDWINFYDENNYFKNKQI